MATSGPQSFAPGAPFGRYVIERELGTGAFGRVYKGRDLRLERVVALKILQEHRPGEPDWGRLLQEARAASALSHPNICAIYDSDEEQGRFYIAMEYVEGETLSEALSRSPGGLPLAAALDYAAQIVAALAHAHARGVVHRDLKTANVMIADDGRAKLLDFGLARRRTADEMEKLTQSHESLAEAGKLAGTLPYVAPEVLRGQPGTAQSDLWAFGVVLYEMLTGELPFRGATPFELSLAIMTSETAPVATGAPHGVQNIVSKCLERDCERRYYQGERVLEDLRREQERMARRASNDDRAAWRWMLPVVAAAALAIGLTTAKWWRASRTAPPTPPVQTQTAPPLPAISPTAPTAPPKRRTGPPESGQVIVWVNTKSKIYHCPGSRWYKKTKNGVAMTQQKARQAGYLPAGGKACP